ncbi:LuxR C-terminal-related transcriptional regulator [Lentzea sp. BCCO 10_0061]|uniref:LuxR C-terminal-related transcriptional regulator n=1 Tax=Lentzea sokolovensis TaxID=3095429 RepID=A0ABU4URB6_9PSEU|nr:LuxR C-terminal-related transcriptional regulator [Lentzea sp. BCCO 10_0061]MDX8141969.1 LuxR C-terminal-related transcriptional regulator [Lentzea sp. BCCO 10_0061]
MLRGRERQRVAVDALVDRARVGRGGVLVVRGEAGSGKTALLDAVRQTYDALLCVDVRELDDDLVQLARDVVGTRAALLIATEGEAYGLPSVTLDPLDPATSLRVLHDLVPGLPATLAADLADLACGNPLALVELAGSLTSAQLGGIAAAPEVLPENSSLRLRWRARFDALSPRAQHVVALVAVDEEIDAEALDLDAVIEAGPLVDPRRLVRSALQVDVPLPLRRRAHAELAETLPPGARRTWHQAVTTQDTGLADVLTTHAEHARLCGDFATAARDHDRAARLTTDPEEKAHRLLKAAADHWAHGAPHRSRAVLRTAVRMTHTPELRALMDLVVGGIDLGESLPDVAADRLVRAAKGLVSTRRTLAVAALGFAGEAASIAGDHRRYTAVAEFAREIRRDDEPPDTRLTLDHLTGMLATFDGRHDVALPALRTVVDLAEQVPGPQARIWASQAAYVLGDATRSHEMATSAVTAARESGFVALVPWALVYRALSALLLDQHAAALTAATEGVHAATAIGQHNAVVDHLTILALLAALRGDADTALDRIDIATEHITQRGLTRPGTFGAWAFACVDLARDRPADALDRLRLQPGHAGIKVMAAPHVVEAAVACGKPSTADRALQPFEKWAGATGSTARMALSHRCHGLLETGTADEHFEEAIRLHRASGTALELAKTELLYGNRLRRGRKPKAAREHLRDAVRIFQSYQADHWVERARAELRAAGDSTSEPRDHPGLTPQQAQIARLVAEGATNREVAARLFLSHRTVEHHLRNIFARLGVRSRVELTRRLD